MIPYSVSTTVSEKYYPDLGSDDMRDHYGISLLILHAQMSFHEETSASDATNC